jgi:hypothetical protein
MYKGTIEKKEIDKIKLMSRSKCSSLGKRAEVLCEENRCLIEPELMEELNLQESTLGWQAGNYSEFWGRTLRDGIELRLGTLNPSQSVSASKFMFLFSRVSTC